uniref:Histone deacetylase complex subunit SAP18 n=1 Tax=Colobus angolensis palliatus TaxID=336983 RepID=A0A2K5IA10_COLAP
MIAAHSNSETSAGRWRKMAVESRVTKEEIKKEPEKSTDREKTCLRLLSIFTTNNGHHHRTDEFSQGNIYVWMDATLKELTNLVKEVYPEARKKGTHFNFAIVFTDVERLGHRVKEVGSTMSGYLDIAITPPHRAPPPSGHTRPY